jgi:hypothetical protein
MRIGKRTRPFAVLALTATGAVCAAIWGWSCRPSIALFKKACAWTTAPETLYFDEDPYETRMPPIAINPDGRVQNFGHTPNCYIRLSTEDEPMAQIEMYPGSYPFVHGRKSKSGRDRLVAIASGIPMLNSTLDANRKVILQPGYRFDFRCGVYEPPPTLRFARLDPGKCSRCLTLTVPPDGRLKVFAGRADPNEESRFFIPYEWKGIRGEIEGILGDDDKVHMRVISGLLQGQ